MDDLASKDKRKTFLPFRAELVENFSNFQPYAMTFREKVNLFAYFCAGVHGWPPEQFDKVKAGLLKNFRLVLIPIGNEDQFYCGLW